MGFDIERISIRPDYLTRNRKGTLTYNIDQDIWSSTTTSDDDGSLTGSSMCCTVRMPEEGAALCVSIHCKNVSIPEGVQEVRLVGGVAGNDILRSDQLRLESQSTLLVKELYLTSTPHGPVRLAGDFAWKFVSTDGQEIQAEQKTRLEICCVFSGPPAGPVQTSEASGQTRPDFGNVYPADIFRLFLPSLQEGTLWAINYWQRYIEKSLQTIWRAGIPGETPPEMRWPADFYLRYETGHGNCSYTERGYGGTFDLQSFVNHYSKTLNCYDIGGLSQIAASIMLARDGQEVGKSVWVYSEPFGFVNPGPLIGWTEFPNSNSPYTIPEHPYYEDAHDTERQGFRNHVWIEIDLTGKAKVLDATHCLQDSQNPDLPGRDYLPANGNFDRDAYIEAQVDLLWYDRDELPKVDRKERKIYAGTEKIPGKPGNWRIGIWHIDGPPTKPKKTEAQPSDMLCEAPCDQETLVRVIQEALPEARFEESKTRVHEPAEISLRFNTPSGTLYIDLDTYGSAEGAKAGLEDSQADLKSLGNTTEQQSIGDGAFSADSLISWVRQNKHVEVQLSLSTLNLKAKIELLKMIASKLDSHLTETVVKADQKRPATKLVRTDQSYHVGKPFTIRVEDIEWALDTHTAEVVPLGSAVLMKTPAAGVFEFLPIVPGDTQLKLVLAHRSHGITETHTLDIHIVQ